MHVSKIFQVLFFYLCFFSNTSEVLYAQKDKPVSPLSVSREGKLVYSPDERGNRIPDFSFAGYKAGEQAIPDVPVKAVVRAVKGDATKAIQTAIDYVASLPADKDGFRGAVLLEKGVYEVGGGLQIKTSGIVLRGSGTGRNGTVLLGTGKDRETLICIRGKNNRVVEREFLINDTYVPVNAMQFSVSNHNLSIGDRVMIRRPSTKEWINALGTDHFGGGLTTLGWKPGQRDIFWDRKVIAVNGDKITIDAPLTTALDTAYGGGRIAKYNWSNRIQQNGVENILLRSVYDKSNPKDEDHRWMAIVVDNAEDVWVRQVSFEHFAGSAVAVWQGAKRVTVEDCKSLAPVSEIGGLRRYPFFTAGQQTLFQRCYSEYGYHDFATGFCSSLNAFVQCESHLPNSFSGGVDSWSSGVLFDIVNIDGGAIRFVNRGQDAQGAGWNMANSVLWQCAASLIENYKPPTAQNWAFGLWAEFNGNGYWESSNEHIQPRSLYYAQLKERLGNEVEKRKFLVPVESEASSSPSVEVAAQLTEQAKNGIVTLSQYIDDAPKRQPILLSSTNAKVFTTTANATDKTANTNAIHLSNGWLVSNNAIAVGKRYEQPWWRGSIHPYATKEAAPAITRFVPGQTGRGYVDDLDELSDSMVDNNRVVFEHNYGLWYERRRDDHERIRRINGEVWGPFYEQPFARSGQSTAWDGLSKYDLTKYNYWYWNRLKAFADLADEKGLLLFHHNYFQHNIIEAGAHYADFPWRPANNINNTGFSEPVPYAGDKRIFMAEQFYDVTHPVRRALHKAYIRQCLNNFRDNKSVVQLISAEYTGPLHFVQFWLDVIGEWEMETGRNALVALSTTKDVQDAILSDAVRSKLIDIIDIRYWHYQADGALYAPKGGQNLAPRQHARSLKPKKTSAAQVYRAIQEYKQKFHQKAVVYSGDSYDQFPWAVLMAGGSLSTLPKETDRSLLKAAATMQPVTLSNTQWALANKRGEYILYTESANPIQIDLSASTGQMTAHWLDAKTGKLIKVEKLPGGKVTLNGVDGGAVVIWIAPQQKQNGQM